MMTQTIARGQQWSLPGCPASCLLSSATCQHPQAKCPQANSRHWSTPGAWSAQGIDHPEVVDTLTSVCPEVTINGHLVFLT